MNQVNFYSKVKEKYYQIIFTLILQEINLIIFVGYNVGIKIECEVIFYLNLFDLFFKAILLLTFTLFIKKRYIISKLISNTFLGLFVVSNEIYLPVLFYNISQGMGEGICPSYIYMVIFFIIFGIVLNVIYACIIGSLNYHLIKFQEINNIFLECQEDEKEVEEVEECIICFKDFSSKEKIKLRCNHSFHKRCILNWFERRKTCPICRMEYH
jgi:hypothetical protein